MCEVLSPSTERKDRIQKLDIYHRAEIGWAWLVDPIAQIVEVYERAEAGWLRLRTASERSEARLEPFEAIALELDGIWPPEAE